MRKYPPAFVHRRIFIGVLFVVGLLMVWSGSAQTRVHSPSAHHHWVGTWACSPMLGDAKNAPPIPDLKDCTLRQIVHVSIGGSRLRVRLSNAFGKSSLKIESVHIALARGGNSIDSGTDKPVTFAGRAVVKVPAGALMDSDPVVFNLAALSGLAVTIYLDGAPDGITIHDGSRSTSYLQSGAWVSAPDLPKAVHFDHWYFLNGVDVEAETLAGSVVVLGDSITDGHGTTTNKNTRWPDFLARRLQAKLGTKGVGVLNEGIGGNRLLLDGIGPNALARLDRDVLAQRGVRWVIVLEGVNDIGTAANAKKYHNGEPATAADLIAADEQIIARAHAHNIRVYGATIMAFGQSFYYTPEAEADRQTVNKWIRTSGKFDAVIDLDAATRDPHDPSHLSKAADSGDHLHPGDEGYRMMGESVNLRLFAK